jgi:uncharacterized protein (DUF1778 family)
MLTMIGIRLEPELKELFQKIAKEERRSLSNFMVNAALVYLKKEHGLEWDKEKLKLKK